jgi:hypothetical protein
MVIGTRRRFGGVVGEGDGAGGGAGTESPMGADRCPRMRVKSQRGSVGNEAKANRRAYCLSLPVHYKLIHARELGLDRFVARF